MYFDDISKCAQSSKESAYKTGLVTISGHTISNDTRYVSKLDAMRLCDNAAYRGFETGLRGCERRADGFLAEVRE